MKGVEIECTWVDKRTDVAQERFAHDPQGGGQFAFEHEGGGGCVVAVGAVVGCCHGGGAVRVVKVDQPREKTEKKGCQRGKQVEQHHE